MKNAVLPKSRLDELDDELIAIQKRFKDQTIFGSFCAGEVAPSGPAVETTDAKVVVPACFCRRIDK